ncbi:MAG: polysaccharide pyruvyl transferase family protein [Firmicutes bacterium]|nr:polysaccharide pyruvyl transferase family protein [Bacillota bacterium]
MKKAGIITFHFADNFGAVLQVYALSKIIEDLGIDVEIIDFIPQKLREGYNLFFNLRSTIPEKGFILTIRSLLGRIYNLKANYLRIMNFNDFRNKHLKFSNRRYKEPIELIEWKPKYDYYITGSDQVWNPNFFSKVGETYFLDFVDENSKKISYAVSIAEKVDEKYYNDFQKHLQRFDFISVREKSAKDFLCKFTNKEIFVTLDPTLLLNKENWSQISTFNFNNIKGKYILVYDLRYDPLMVEIANKVAKETGYKIISYSRNTKYYKKYVNWDSSFYSKNPTDFLGLYDNAEFIVTNSFHGTAFSVIYNKPFFTVPHPTRGSRMIDLLVVLDLQNRIIRNNEDIHMIIKSMNFSNVNKKLSDLREQSINYLKNALDIN